MKKYFRIGIFLVCTVFLNFSIFSQQGENEIEEMSLEDLLNVEINVGSSVALTIFNTPSTVSVIDQNMIRQFHFKSVSEAVNLVAGVDIQRTYLKREMPTSRGILQDHYANKVLVLINGIPSWNAVTGEANIMRVDINDVDRIEILKGPASVLYGTNAYSGAVNIVLKKTNEQSASSHFSAGLHSEFNAGGNYIYSKDNYSIFISGNSTDEKGQDYIFVDEKGVKGHYKEYLRTKNFTVATQYKGHSLFFNASRSNESYLGVEPIFASGTGNDHVTDGYLLNYKFNHSFSGFFKLNYGIAYDWNKRNLSRTADDNTRSNLYGSRLTNNLAVNYSAVDNLGLDLGFEYDFRKANEYTNYNVQKDSVTAQNEMNGKKIYEYSVFFQASYQFSSFNLLAGTRYSHNEFFKNNLSSRATLVYSVNDKNSFKIIWGQSYRAPSLFELYFATPTKTVFGNLNLKPEKSNSVELAYLTSFNYFFAQTLFYYSTYENKIFRVRRLPNSATDKSTIYTNGTSFKAKGLEFELKYQNPELLTAFANYSFIDGNSGDEVSGNGHYNFKYVPKHTVSAGLSKSISTFDISIVGNYASQTKGPLTKVGDYVTVDFGFGYKQSVGSYNLLHSITVKNAFDKLIPFPEFSRRVLNQVQSGYGRRIAYEMNLELK
jgi:outer membrane receptor protein involved in Fe transport